MKNTLKCCAVFWPVSCVVVAVVMYYMLNIEYPAPEIPETWWGDGERQPDNPELKKVVVIIPEGMLTDVKERLAKARFQADLTDADFTYGFQSTYLREVVQYWRTQYDWRKQETILNQYLHYMTFIEGIKVHFVHAKPTEEAGGKKRIPLLLMHGWPGSVYEFYKILPLLTDTSQDLVFEVVCPSMLGYGFSAAPTRKGMDMSQMARIYSILMSRLGYERYYVQGGDWGAGIATIMAMAYPQHVIGAHLNTIAPTATPKSLLKLVIGGFWPSLTYTPEEAELMWPMTDRLKFLVAEQGYGLLQMTKPDTVGAALVDSPVGLAAYILEKFSTWTNRTNRDTKNGALTDRFTLDDLLTNVMIYWFNGNIGSSMRLYKEVINSETDKAWKNVRVQRPVGLAVFPHDLFFLPQSVASDKFLDLVQFTLMPRGGHFPALEETHLLLNDFRGFVRKVQERDGEEGVGTEEAGEGEGEREEEVVEEVEGEKEPEKGEGET